MNLFVVLIPIQIDSCINFYHSKNYTGDSSRTVTVLLEGFSMNWGKMELSCSLLELVTPKSICYSADSIATCQNFIFFR